MTRGMQPLGLSALLTGGLLLGPPGWMADIAPNYDLGKVEDLAQFAGSTEAKRVAELARKQLTGQKLSDADTAWIRGYGVNLAGFHFYYGNSYLVPRDDFPMVTRIFASPVTDSVLYAGLARPQALYLLVPDGGKLQLYRGAVLNYREFVRPTDEALDDEVWRQQVASGALPPAPGFTRAFFAEMSLDEITQALRRAPDDESRSHRDTESLLRQLRSRTTIQDLSKLIAFLQEAAGSLENEVIEAVTEAIAGLPWEPEQDRLIEWLASANSRLADAAARILQRRSQALNVQKLTHGFGSQPERTRRLYSVLLGSRLEASAPSQVTLLGALNDPAPGVRWQAALAIGQAKWKEDRSLRALTERLDDTNEFVAAAAAHALARLGASNGAPVLLGKLQTRALSAAPELRQQQASAISGEADAVRLELNSVLEVDGLGRRIRFTRYERPGATPVSLLPPIRRETSGFDLDVRPAHQRACP